MTIVDQIIASLRDEPEMWEYRDRCYFDHPNYELTSLCGYAREVGHGFFGTTIWERFRLRRAVRKWQRRVR